MNILFITLLNISHPDERSIYTDLLREFQRAGHNIYIAAASEKRNGVKTNIKTYPTGTVLQIRTGNIQKTGVIKKGISTILLERQFIQAFKKYLSGIHFDAVIYSTPPITLYGAVKFIKKRDGAKSFLLLKDIFPQNAVDLALLKTTGIWNIIYRYFKHKEEKLYQISDHIGCMSCKNVEYLLKQNPKLPKDKVSVLPNSQQPKEYAGIEQIRQDFCSRYNIPEKAKLFIFGGNIGMPQAVDYIFRCLKACQDIPNVYFIFCGNGTNFRHLERFIEDEQHQRIRVLPLLPFDDFHILVAACDCGLIFLDHRFTIPNFPSRLLAYMNGHIPVLAATDRNTDIGDVIKEGNFGWWCCSDDVDSFKEIVTAISRDAYDLKSLGENGYQYFIEHYTASKGYEEFMRWYEGC